MCIEKKKNSAFLCYFVFLTITAVFNESFSNTISPIFFLFSIPNSLLMVC